MLADYFSNLFDIQINYMAVIVAALAYFILAIIWYSPQVFGEELVHHEIINRNRMPSSILAYIGEFIVDLIMAFVLALVIEFARVDTSLEGLKIALWMWIGFVATTHFCDVLWGRKSLTSYLISGGLILVGLLVMGAIIPAVRDSFPDYIF
jgi:hypothetical protein